MDRRIFFKNVFRLSAAATLAPVFFSPWSIKAFAEESRRKSLTTGLTMVDTTDPTAKALEYVDVAKKNPKSKGNSCANCQLYNKQKDLKDGREIGACALFPNKSVFAGAFCNSWAAKPA